MTFTAVDLIYALAFGLIVGVFVLHGFNTQHSTSNPGALTALKERMGSLYSVAVIAGGGLPLMVVGLLANGLRGQPSLPDLMLLIVLIGLSLLASFVLLGNVMTLLGERTRPEKQG